MRPQRQRERVRKGQSDLIRISLRHEDSRRRVRQRLREEEMRDALDEWAEEYEGHGIWDD